MVLNQQQISHKLIQILTLIQIFTNRLNGEYTSPGFREDVNIDQIDSHQNIQFVILLTQEMKELFGNGSLIVDIDMEHKDIEG